MMNDMNMEQLVSELQKIMRFKKEIDTGDVVLIVADEPRLLAYAVVTDIEADASRKDPWWHVSMEMLAVPLQPMTWTLRMEQMCGQEIFTMGGKNGLWPLWPSAIKRGSKRISALAATKRGQQQERKKVVCESSKNDFVRSDRPVDTDLRYDRTGPSRLFFICRMNRI